MLMWIFPHDLHVGNVKQDSVNLYQICINMNKDHPQGWTSWKCRHDHGSIFKAHVWTLQNEWHHISSGCFSFVVLAWNCAFLKPKFSFSFTDLKTTIRNGTPLVSTLGKFVLIQQPLVRPQADLNLLVSPDWLLVWLELVYCPLLWVSTFGPV